MPVIATTHVITHGVAARIFALNVEYYLLPAAFEVVTVKLAFLHHLACRRAAPDLEGLTRFDFINRELTIHIPVRPHGQVFAPSAARVGFFFELQKHIFA